MPTQIVGTCPWCERHEVNLYLVAGITREDGPIAQYICHRCMEAMNIIQEIRERNRAVSE